MNREANKWEKRADKIRENFGNAINALADERLSVLVAEWKLTYPTHSLHILFGMGQDVVTIDGKFAYYERLPRHEGRDYPAHLISRNGDGHRRDATIDLIDDALADVTLICNGYSDGCPNDIDVKASPRKRANKKT